MIIISIKSNTASRQFADVVSFEGNSLYKLKLPDTVIETEALHNIRYFSGETVLVEKVDSRYFIIGRRN